MTIDTNSSFWKTFPELKFVPGLGELYTQDKSKNKQRSSKIMWAVYMCEMPSSKLYNRPNKYEEVETRFMKGEKFTFADNENLVDSFRDSALSEAELAITDWNDLMKLRRSNLRRLYTESIVNKQPDEIDTKSLMELDKMLAATPKLFDDYKKAKKDFEEELIHKKGAAVASLSDSDEI